MRRTSILVLAVCLVVGAVGLCVWHYRIPHLTIINSYEAGEAPPKSSRSFVIDYCNSSFGTLKISKMTASCGCTKAEIDKPHLSHNEHGSLHVVIYSGAFLGPRLVHIYIESNDPAQPVTTVDIKMTVDDVFNVFPDRIDLGDISRDKFPLNGEIVVKSGLKNALPDDLTVSFDRDYMKVSYDRSTAPDYYTIKYSLSDRIPNGFISSNIILRSKKTDYKLVIPITGNVEGPVELTPAYAFLPEIGNDEVRQCKVAFSGNSVGSYHVKIMPDSLNNILSVTTFPGYFILKTKTSDAMFGTDGIALVVSKQNNQPICELPIYGGSQKE